MKAIVHIGMPKAGSSSIQEFLFQNRLALADQGFRFHRNVKRRGSQFEYVLAALTRAGTLLPRQQQRLHYNARTLEEQSDSATKGIVALEDYPNRWSEDVALFSSEHMEPWLKTPDLIRTVDGMFREVFSDVRYVLYIRSPVDSIVSQYSESIKRGSTQTLDNFVKLRGRRVDIDLVTSRWADIVGKERLTVRLLDKTFLKNGDLIEDFSAVCGFDPTPMTQPPRVNEALTASGAECMRALNRKIPEVHSEGGRNPLRFNLLAAVMRLSADGPKLTLSPEQRNRVENAVADTNETFRQKYFPERDVLFEHRPPKDANVPRRKILDMALDVMTDVLIELRLNQIDPLTRKQMKRAMVGQLKE
ncbi:hypothetical protein [Tropicimonas marinistellae]|uniref:hypothetical protein n=1 Tax=Tropicimonas marinistellae TaxID=1739787 RepID=UPI00083603FB|nr:hypothetical protein [Tropicimonas marinistellae]